MNIHELRVEHDSIKILKWTASYDAYFENIKYCDLMATVFFFVKKLY